MRSKPGSSRRPDWPLAVVIGAGGLGMATARRLGLSHRLLIADRDEEQLIQKVEGLNTGGYDAVGVRCDVTLASDVRALALEAGRCGNVRSLAYVVGLSPSLGDFDTIISVNFLGATRTLQAFADRLESGGAALCISSSSAHMQSIPESTLELLEEPLIDGFLDTLKAQLANKLSPADAYVLSKKGLIRYCQRVAPEWGKRGLRVVSLSPGLIATPQGAIEYQGSASKMTLFEATPLGREATMLEISDVAEFLLSDRASFISGTDLLVDGGLIASLGTRKFS